MFTTRFLVDPLVGLLETLSHLPHPTATLSHFLQESHRRSLTSCRKVTDALSLLVGYDGGLLA
jgi:hypothetical protein